MFLIVGLGNPGKKYKNTRHNIGFRIIDKLPKRSGLILAKLQVFMNKSGEEVKGLVKLHRIKPENLWVIHDDIDLTIGKIRISKSRGSAGHKGVCSIIKEIKTKKFVRFRIGIQPKIGKPKNVNKFVLQKFTKEEEKIIKQVIKKTSRALKIALLEGLEKAMNKFN